MTPVGRMAPGQIQGRPRGFTCFDDSPSGSRAYYDFFDYSDIMEYMQQYLRLRYMPLQRPPLP
jgi:hypothetical protein